jgi:hypothetical protein
MRAALIYQHATESRSREHAERLDTLVTAHREAGNARKTKTLVARSLHADPFEGHERRSRRPGQTS